jgi:hypothetical protein
MTTLNNQHPKTVARALGLLFLLVIICGVFAQGLVSERLIDFHDAAATATTSWRTKVCLRSASPSI